MNSPPLELPADVPGLEIPEGYLSVIASPDVNVPVGRFRFHVLQEQKAALVFPPAETSFTTLPPSTACDLSGLAKHPIPSAKYLQSLKTYLNNSSDGMRLSFRSIRNPSDRMELLPLWVLTLWDKVSSLIDCRNKWVQSCLWVQRLQATHQEGKQLASTHFRTLGWGSELPLYGLRGITNLSLAQFLGDTRINSEAIDLMSRFLSYHPDRPAGVLVFDLRLSNFLSTVRSREAFDHPSPPHIEELEHQLTQANALYFPSFHAKHEHWVAFKVNICRREIVYGTSTID
jgi:hypothetical protein